MAQACDEGGDAGGPKRRERRSQQLQSCESEEQAPPATHARSGTATAAGEREREGERECDGESRKALAASDLTATAAAILSLSHTPAIIHSQFS